MLGLWTCICYLSGCLVSEPFISVGLAGRQDSTTEVEKPNFPIFCLPGKKGEVPQTCPPAQSAQSLQLPSLISWIGDGGAGCGGVGVGPAFVGHWWNTHLWLPVLGSGSRRVVPGLFCTEVLAVVLSVISYIALHLPSHSLQPSR